MTSISVLESLVRQNAYELWEVRGRSYGNDLEDWYDAERYLREILNRYGYFLLNFTYVDQGYIKNVRYISHEGKNDFLREPNVWIETYAALKTIIEFDRNRKLHFDEGFLWACYRIFEDDTIQCISERDHFPYKDLKKFRNKVKQYVEKHKRGVEIVPPLFFYPAQNQLEILDGVHRCLAKFDACNLHRHKNIFEDLDFIKIWVGFDQEKFSGEDLVMQIIKNAFFL
jgi:hypothetical protein